MRILITGITGFVGRHLAERWKANNSLQVAGTGRSFNRQAHLPENIAYLPLEITNETDVHALITSYTPDIVVHSAAMSKPNDCELQQQLCYDVNVNATRYVIDACKKNGSKLIFMSTDFVFGDDGPYSEDDAYSPVNYYGQSKVFAEEIVRSSNIEYAVVRTVLVYGKQLEGLNPTFPQWVKGQLEKGNSIRVFTDQYRTATFVNDLTSGIDSIVAGNATGIFHFCGSETFTPFDIATKVASHFGFDTKLILPVTRGDFAEAARRPIKSTLAIEKAKRELLYSPTPLADALPLIF